MRRHLSALLAAAALCAAPAAAQQPQPAKLRGTVVSADDGAPLAEAQVELVGLGRVLNTATDGRFDFGEVAPASYQVQVRLIGYRPYSFRANLAPASTLDATVKLSRGAVVIPEAVVTERRDPTGFYDRKASSPGGTFIDRAEIERRRPAVTTDLLANTAGLQVSCPTLSNCRVRFTRGQNCAPTVFLDGARGMGQILETNNIAPEQLEGIEIYRSPAEAPAQYSVGGSSCGVILLWTRR